MADPADDPLIRRRRLRPPGPAAANRPAAALPFRPAGGRLGRG